MPEDLTGFNLTAIATADKESIEIAAGDITPVKRFIILEAQTGTADDLDGIITSSILSPGDADGAVIYLMADVGDTHTIRHNQNAAATKNILTSTGKSIILQGNTVLACYYNIALDTNGAWVVVEPDFHADAYNGSFLEPFTFVISEAGGVITGTLDANPSGDLTERFSDGYSTASSGISIALTAGADDAPVLNYVYILQSNKGVLAKSTSDWPATEHNKIAEVILQTAAKTQTEGGALVNRNWNDSAIETNGMGHHLEAWERLRHEHSAWKSGAAITWTIDSVPNPDTVNLAVTAAKVYQLHIQDFEAKDTAGGDNVHVVNDSGTPYTEITDFASLLTDNAGGSMSGRYFNLVVWGSVSSGSEVEHLFVNLPGGSYNRQADALADPSGFTVFDIPEDFRGKAFLIARITLRHQAAASGTWTSIRETSLRGLVPNIVAGGGTSAITTEFADNQWKVFGDGDPTKVMRFEVDGISASTERTLTVPDGDGTLILATGLAGGQTLIGDTASGGDLTLKGTSHVDANGQILIPNATAAGQGLLLGGDVELYRSNANELTIPDDVLIANPSGVLRFTGTAGGGASGLTYQDSGSSNRFAMFFVNDVVVVCNRAANGTVEIRANTATAGVGGEVTVATFAATGQVTLPVTGSGAGLLIGGDIHLYENGANVAQLDTGVADATMALSATKQEFGSAIATVKFLNATAVEFQNAAATPIVKFSDTTVSATPSVEFATGLLNVNQDIQIAGFIDIDEEASEPAAPSSGTRRLFANPALDDLSVKTSDSAVRSLENEMIFADWTLADWTTRDQWTDALSAGASITANILQTIFATGNTSGAGTDRARSYTAVGGLSPHSGQRLWAMAMQNNGAGTITSRTIRFYALKTGATNPPVDDDNEAYIGWRIVGARIWAVSHNGTIGQEVATDTGIDVSGDFSSAFFVIKGGSGSEATFYHKASANVGYDLVATHNTNMPSQFNYFEYHDILNGVNANKAVRVQHSSWRF